LLVAQDPGAPVPWRPSDAARAIGLVFAGFFVVLLLAGLSPSRENGEASSVTLWLISLTDGLMLLAVWLFGIKKYRVPWETVGLRRPLVRNRLGLPAAALVGSLAFGTAYAATVSALGVDALQPEELPADLLGQGVTRVLNTVVILFWGPFTEEIFFRGFLFAALIAPFGAVRAAVISSAVFALAHVSIATMPPIFVTGLLMSWLYLKGRSVWLPFSAHMAQNLIALSVFL